MPYKRYGYKKYSRRSRFKKGKGKSGGGWLSYGSSALAMASRALSIAKGVATLINVEKKFSDITITPSGTTKTPGVQWISAISEGSDYNNRTGISVKASSLLMRGYVQLPATATQGHSLRVILFRDNDMGGVAPVASDVLETATDLLSPINHVNGNRFTVLRDQLVNVSNTGPDIRTFKWFIKLNDHIKWSNSSTGIREGHMYVLFLTDTNTGTEAPSFGFDTRLRFIDN